MEGPDRGPMEIAGFLAAAQWGIVISQAGQHGVLGLGLSTSLGRAAPRTRIHQSGSRVDASHFLCSPRSIANDHHGRTTLAVVESVILCHNKT